MISEQSRGFGIALKNKPYKHLKYYFLFLFSFICLLSCQDDTVKTENLLYKIPKSSDVILKFNNLETLRSGIKNNQLLQGIADFKSIQQFTMALKPLDFILTDHTIYIGLETEASDSLKISIVTKLDTNTLQLDSISNLLVEPFGTNNEKSINQITIDDAVYYSTSKDSILFISNRLDLVEKSMAQQQTATQMEALFATAGLEQSLSIYIKENDSALNFDFLRNKFNDSLTFSKHTILDVDVSQNDLYFNGITKAPFSSGALINKFKGSRAQHNRIAEICPTTTSHFTSFTTHNIHHLKQSFIKKPIHDSLGLKTDFFLDNIMEFGEAHVDGSTIFTMRSIDPIGTYDALESEQINSIFRSVEIFNFNAPEIFSDTFSPLVSNIAAPYYINLDDFFVFSDNLTVLQTVISNYQNGTVLSNDESFIAFMTHFSDESSIFIFNNEDALEQQLMASFDETETVDLKIYETSGIQYVYENDFAHINGAFKTFKNRESSNQITEELNFTLDADVLGSPQLVKNHTNNQMDIAVQDVNNNLYLISNEGKLFWKKQLDGKIMGKIQQIDIYKNGRLQLAFATANHVHVLDRNGRDVAPFPLNFNDKITQPLSVFDYANKRNYRLLVTQGKSLLMYDQLGKRVNGFKYSSAENNIITQPKHFRIGSKDYIAFGEGNHLEILDRVGKTRIKVKEDILFSGNEIYLYNNYFTTTNVNGELLEVDQNGKIKHSNLNLKDHHKITTTSKSLVTLSDNKLTIKTNPFTLDFGNYTAPSIFYVNDKIYVSVTDLQAKKIYLFDSQAQPIAHFPVYGNSGIELGNIDGDESLEFVTQGSNSSILVYKFN